MRHGSVLLGHVRLSLVDLAFGDQPIFNEDHCVGIVFNGEIYDYAAHRRQLVAAGHRFRTESDTEAVRGAPGRERCGIRDDRPDAARARRAL